MHLFAMFNPTEQNYEKINNYKKAIAINGIACKSQQQITLDMMYYNIIDSNCLMN